MILGYVIDIVILYHASAKTLLKLVGLPDNRHSRIIPVLFN